MTEALLEQVINGLMMGSIYVLVALGLVLIYGVMHVVNFAHGVLFTLGGYLGHFFFSQCWDNYWVATLLSMLSVGLVGYALERGVFRPLSGNLRNQVIASLGLILAFENAVIALWGPNALQWKVASTEQLVSLGELRFSVHHLGIIALTMIMITALGLFLKHTRFGTAIRATSQNQEAALVVGIPVQRVQWSTFVLGSALAALGGCLVGPWAWPVVEFRPRHLCLPNTHPCHAGYETAPWLAHADLIVVLDCDVPWIPAQGEPAAHVPVVHVGSDPLFARYPTRGFRADLALAVRPLAFLQALQKALGPFTPEHQALAQRQTLLANAAAQRQHAMAQRVAQGQSRTPMDMASVSQALDQALQDHSGEAVVVNEYSLVPAAMRLRAPGSYFGSSPVGGLGWGLPAAMGIKLARPDALVVAAVGDGSYSFSSPLACHHTAAMHGIAVLTLVMDNGGYGAVERATRAMYPQGAAVQQGMDLVSLAPMPRFDQVIASCGGWGERVDHFENLAGALARAIHQTQVEKRQALLQVSCA